MTARTRQELTAQHAVLNDLIQQLQPHFGDADLQDGIATAVSAALQLQEGIRGSLETAPDLAVALDTRIQGLRASDRGYQRDAESAHALGDREAAAGYEARADVCAQIADGLAELVADLLREDAS